MRAIEYWCPNGSITHGSGKRTAAAASRKRCGICIYIHIINYAATTTAATKLCKLLTCKQEIPYDVTAQQNLWLDRRKTRSARYLQRCLRIPPGAVYLCTAYMSNSYVYSLSVSSNLFTPRFPVTAVMCNRSIKNGPLGRTCRNSAPSLENNHSRCRTPEVFLCSELEW